MKKITPVVSPPLSWPFLCLLWLFALSLFKVGQPEVGLVEIFYNKINQFNYNNKNILDFVFFFSTSKIKKSTNFISLIVKHVLWVLWNIIRSYCLDVKVGHEAGWKVGRATTRLKSRRGRLRYVCIFQIRIANIVRNYLCIFDNCTTSVLTYLCWENIIFR